LEKQTSSYRWVVFTAVSLAYFIIVSQRTAPGLISDQIMKEFHLTAATIGILASIQFLAYTALQTPIGILSDRFGPNFFLIIGALLNGIGTVIYSLAPNEWVLLFARLLTGMGDAAIWVNLVLILSQWFKVNEFIKMLGFAGMTGSFGFLLATVPYSAWIAKAGWRTPFFTTGILLCLIGMMLHYVLVKKPKDLFKDTSGTAGTKKQRESTMTLLRRICSERQTWAAFLCHFGLVGTYIGFIGSWAVSYGMQVYGMTRSGASQLIMIGLVGALIGAPLTSWITSRIDSIKRPYMVVHLIVIASWGTFLLFSGEPPKYLLILLFFLIGYGNGASALTFAVVRKSFPVTEVGVVSGVANTGGFLSAVLLPGIFGKVLDHFHSSSVQVGYGYGLVIPVVFTIVGLVGSMLLKEQHYNKKQGELSFSKAHVKDF
jgi:MFS family permease